MATIVDSYSESNRNTDTAGPNRGQSFTGDGGVLNSAKFYLYKAGSPTGNSRAKIYAHSGTFGTSSIPTGSALATSDDIDISTFSTSQQLVTFTFSGANKITLDNGTKYIVVIEIDYTPSDPNYIWIGLDTSSPSHNGNYSFFSSGTWTPDSSIDMCFYVYKDDATTTSTTTSTSTSSSTTTTVSVTTSTSTTSTTTSTTTTTTSTSTTTTTTSTTTTLPPRSPLGFQGIKKSKLGYNVLLTNEPNELNFTSAYDTLKYYYAGYLTVSLSVEGGNNAETTAAFNHDLGYFPFHVAYIKSSSGSVYYPQSYVNLGSGAIVYETTYITKNQIVLYMRIENNPGEPTVDETAYCYFKIFRNKLNLT